MRMTGMMTAAATAVVALISLAILTATTAPTMANPAIAKSTGQPCTKCHTAAPALNAYGKKYKDTQKK